MCTPFKASLVSSSGVFVAALLDGLLHHDTVNGRTLTPLEELPAALIEAIFFSALALLGTWLGLRRADGRQLTYRTGLMVALVYVVATFLVSALISTTPQTVTFPSRQANIFALEVLLIGAAWGVGAPCAIALLVRRFRFFGASHGA